MGKVETCGVMILHRRHSSRTSSYRATGNKQTPGLVYSVS